MRLNRGSCPLVNGRLWIVGRSVTGVGYPPSEPFEAGADDYLMLVDAEVGVILRLSSRLRGEEFDLLEVVEIAFDESFSEGTFVSEMPGVEFHEVNR